MGDLTDLSDIPRIMHRQGWLNGERLLNRWFSGAPHVAPRYASPDTSISLEWVLRFSRARRVFDAMVDGRVWFNEAARRVIGDWLRSNGHLGSRWQGFGNLDRPVPELDRDSVQFRVVEETIPSMDDLTAALGNFTFRVAIEGATAPNRTRGNTVAIYAVGIYVKDSFDFNGYQELGFWNSRYATVSYSNPMIGDRVTNASFREWRAANGRGGDFLVFSNMRRMVFGTPDRFVVGA